MNMKELNKIKDITTLKTDKYSLIEMLKDRDMILDMIKTGFFDKEKVVAELSQWMDKNDISGFLNDSKEFNFEFQL